MSEDHFDTEKSVAARRVKVEEIEPSFEINQCGMRAGHNRIIGKHFVDLLDACNDGLLLVEDVSEEVSIKDSDEASSSPAEDYENDDY